MAQLNSTTINGDCNITGNLTITTGGGKINPIVDLIYPIGSYFITENITLFPDVNAVANYFGGTWVRVNSLFLRSTSDNSQIGRNGATAQDGGYDDATLVSHKHTLYVYNDDFSNGGDDTSFENKKNKPGFTYDVGQSAGSWSYTQISTEGSSATGKNRPPYRNVIFYRRTA